MLFDGVKLLVLNWRLSLVQLLPAMWIWIAMYDLKGHEFRDRSLHVLSGPLLIFIIAAIGVITAASFFLNAVFAFRDHCAPSPPKIGPAFRQARSHLAVVLGAGGAVGLLLGVSAVVVDRWGSIWFANPDDHRDRHHVGVLPRRTVMVDRHDTPQEIPT